jgi:hypothetical protein
LSFQREPRYFLSPTDNLGQRNDLIFSSQTPSIEEEAIKHVSWNWLFGFETGGMFIL